VVRALALRQLDRGLSMPAVGSLVGVSGVPELITLSRQFRPQFLSSCVRNLGEERQGTRGWFDSALRDGGANGYTSHCNRHTFASRLVMAGCGHPNSWRATHFGLKHTRGELAEPG
jgi:hypothetical protein